MKVYGPLFIPTPALPRVNQRGRCPGPSIPATPPATDGLPTKALEPVTKPVSVTKPTPAKVMKSTPCYLLLGLKVNSKKLWYIDKLRVTKKPPVKLPIGRGSKVYASIISSAPMPALPLFCPRDDR